MTQRSRWPQAEVTPAWARPRVRAEIWIVLGLTLGQSAVFAALSLLRKLTAEGGLGAQTSTLNASRASQPWLDLLIQLAQIGFGLVPVLFVLWLLAARAAAAGGRTEPALTGAGFGVGAARLGLHDLWSWRTVGRGCLLAAVIGLPGLALYAVGRLLGLTANVVPAALDPNWWSIPVLLLAAVQAALLEETVVSGWLVIRLREISWGWPAVFVFAALLRGSYHLYQGVGPFVGNAVMGVVFLWAARRWGGVAPLVVAHFLLDACAFVGWQLAGPWLLSTGLLG
ncbi:CPBP family intramembrane glutamic endopeptidase [Pseudoclavibacter sp. 13-3]|uniref:CPBP family intramembrane glutamic endopeptidase n=1 Tax=Pseudoclavibacter sp. 13-3 TaxID=2901228 RepID=UPI001E38E3FF|nr:CPBP family intramembrane glutamic endopeptidase [Pseudoclavibacter sp. 13-3]MCD7102103.1 CPBP family intramembrane metalloprotease [Pseudoclavibacter sp. 13-3]